MSSKEQNRRIAITNVRVFDGEKLCSTSTIIIKDGIIDSDNEMGDAETVDGEGGVLLPGLIDTHIHLHGVHNLHQVASYGVTTGFDMATLDLKLLTSLRGRAGLTDIRSAGIPATSAGSRHAKMLPDYPVEYLVANPTEAEKFVADRIADGSDYIKIIADIPGPDQASVNALAAAARKHGKLSVAHAANVAAWRMAQEANVDIITHVPTDKAMPQDVVDTMLAKKIVCSPTLSMMEGILNNLQALRLMGSKYSYARNAVKDLHEAGVPILVGTDANDQRGSPSQVPHGQSLHHEMELLVAAGMSTVDVLRGATSLAAQHFGLQDRGVVKPGYRADLVLIKGDPIQDIRKTRLISRVWCAGIEYTPVVCNPSTAMEVPSQGMPLVLKCCAM